MIHSVHLLRYLLVASALILSLSATNQPSTGTGDLTVVVKNIRNNKGQIGLNLFHAANDFPNHPEKSMFSVFIPAKAGSTEYTFKNIPTDTYAVAVFHDENGDGKINSNFLGIPKEGVGVSNNAKGNFGPPKFDDAKFSFNSLTQTVTINLTYF
jgi:uncharacterized protein (DUF2141 family)